MIASAFSFISSAAPATSGKCGDNVFWSFDAETGELVIEGEGDMYDYSEYSHSPWYAGGFKDDIVSVKIQYGVSSVGDYAFWRCTWLSSVKLSYGLLSIGDSSFRECTELRYINIPWTVETIGDFAFAYCNYMNSVRLPKNLKRIGSSAFTEPDPEYYFISVMFGGTKEEWKTVEIGEGNDALFAGRFTYNTEPDLTGICGDGVYWAYWIEKCELRIWGDGYMYDWADTFETPWYNVLDDVMTVWIEEGVRSIGNNAFVWANVMSDAKLPDTLVSIGDNAFAKCMRLSIEGIPDSVTHIGKGAFVMCNRLLNFHLPSDITEIPEGMFKMSERLLSVRIGKEIKTVERRAFDGCDGLKVIFFEGTEEEWNEINIEPENEPLLGATVVFNDGPCPHAWYTTINSTPPTYTEDGQEEVICYICFASETRVIPRLISDIAGDADGDGIVSMKDLLHIRKVLAGADKIDNNYIANADLNNDGDLNMKDVLTLRKSMFS